MTLEEKEAFVLSLEDELLKGGVMLPEWTTRISQEAIESFVGGRHLACLLTGMAAIETQLRSDHGGSQTRLQDLVKESGFPNALKESLHSLRRYRNRWVHVSDPWDDQVLLGKSDAVEEELFQMSKLCVELMMRVLFSKQWV
jgi:hypothetical protein